MNGIEQHHANKVSKVLSLTSVFLSSLLRYYSLAFLLDNDDDGDDEEEAEKFCLNSFKQNFSASYFYLGQTKRL